MKITTTKSQLKNTINQSYTALLKNNLPAKRSVLQDSITNLLTDGGRKYSSLMSEWTFENTKKTFDFHPYADNEYRGFEKSWYEAIYPVLESRMPTKFAPVCVWGDMTPTKIINADNGLYQVTERLGSFQQSHLGNYFKKYGRFTDKTFSFAIFKTEQIDVECQSAIKFSMQTLIDGEVCQQEDLLEWITESGKCERRYSHLKTNQAGLLSSLFDYSSLPQSMPLEDKIPFDSIFDALDEIMEREDRLVIWKDANDMIDSATKVENAKDFANRIKLPIFELSAYDEGEKVPDSVYLEIWNYIWNNINADEISFGVEPYIELSKFETKSGQTEIFNLNFDADYLLDYDRSGLKEFTVKGFLDQFDVKADDILINPYTGSEDTAENWASDFVANWGNLAYLPSMFYSLEVVDE